jgi:hypothetical protein
MKDHSWHWNINNERKYRKYDCVIESERMSRKIGAKKQ